MEAAGAGGHDYPLPRRRLRRGRLVRGQPWYSHEFNRKPKSALRLIVQRPWHFPVVAQHLASIQIQRIAKGFVTRLRLRLRRRRRRGRRRRGKPPPPRPRAALATRFLSWKKDVVPGGVPVTDPMAGFDHWCIVRIQAWWRMLSVRQHFQWARFSVYHIAAMQIQNLWRATKVPPPPRFDPVAMFVTRIQRAYRSYCDRLVFNHYRDMLAFRNAGDPYAMLRAVNPREAALLDPASGLRVRFRLGGARFPPQIMYKLFTTSPVCDVNAFAPKDYTESSARAVPPGAIHNKPVAVAVGASRFSATLPSTASGVASGEPYEPPPSWYHRVDNNGWRPISVKAMEEDAVEDSAPRKPAVFHFSKARRKVDAAVRAKRRKREWMWKMYKEGLAKERGEGAAASLADFGGEEWEAEAVELLEWTEGLDFDRYVADWSQVGTSGGVAAVTSVLEPDAVEVGAAYESLWGSSLDPALLPTGAEYPMGGPVFKPPTAGFHPAGAVRMEDSSPDGWA